MYVYIFNKDDILVTGKISLENEVNTIRIVLKKLNV